MSTLKPKFYGKCYFQENQIRFWNARYRSLKFGLLFPIPNLKVFNFETCFKSLIFHVIPYLVSLIFLIKRIKLNNINIIYFILLFHFTDVFESDLFEFTARFTWKSEDLKIFALSTWTAVFAPRRKCNIFSQKSNFVVQPSTNVKTGFLQLIYSDIKPKTRIYVSNYHVINDNKNILQFFNFSWPKKLYIKLTIKTFMQDSVLRISKVLLNQLIGILLNYHKVL